MSEQLENIWIITGEITTSERHRRVNDSIILELDTTTHYLLHIVKVILWLCSEQSLFLFYTSSLICKLNPRWIQEQVRDLFLPLTGSFRQFLHSGFCCERRFQISEHVEFTELNKPLRWRAEVRFLQLKHLKTIRHQDVGDLRSYKMIHNSTWKIKRFPFLTLILE